MKKQYPFQHVGEMKIVAPLIMILLLAFSSFIRAQGDGPRFYWKSLAGLNAMPIIGSSLNGNTNPFDPAHTVETGSDFKATLALAGYARMFSLFNRSAMASIILPMGMVTSTVNIKGGTTSQTAMGFGDPMLQFGINVVGLKAIKSIPDILRYRPGFSIDIIGSLAIPIGNYDDSSAVNIGQNRWYGRIGLPIVCQIGKWVPGRRTTIEALPAIWFFSDNNDFLGQKSETRPMLQVEAHVTRDFMERLWGSINFIWYYGAKATISSSDTTTNTPGLNNIGIGGTLGYQINDNMQLSVTYATTLNDKETDDLKMSTFRVSLIFGWHRLIEGMHRLKGEN